MTDNTDSGYDIDEDPLFNPPDQAVEAYPDECANCGAGADPFWIPRDYHERSDPDPGACTECWHHFGTGESRGEHR